jgi:ATP-dependent DNA ligase
MNDLASKPAPSLGALSVGLDSLPMEARAVPKLPDGLGWQFEPKWDGFRCLAFKAGEEVELKAKSGKPLGRYFPEVVHALGALGPASFVIDGELVIPQDETLSFDALQLRLHPAESRIQKLSRTTPARLVLFDMLLTAAGRDLRSTPLEERRVELEAFWQGLDDPGLLRLSPCTRDRAEADGWLSKLGGALDGVIAKRLDGPYEGGERAMLKIKHMRTADCVVGGFRYETKAKQVGSLLLGLYDEGGRLDHVGFTSGIADADKPALTKMLEGLIEPPGFTGDAPGGPSRWSNARSAAWQPLRPELIAEVQYDHVTGNRFRHGTRFLRWRPDKSPAQCTFEQIEREAGPSRMLAMMES